MSTQGIAEHYATFTVCRLLFGIDVLRVQEVLRNQPLMRVPLAGEEVAGLINLRGHIVTALRLDMSLGLPAVPVTQGNPETVVVTTPEGAVSLVVDAIEDVVTPDPASYEGPPENLERPVRDFVTGIYKLKDRILFVLDADRVTSRKAATASHPVSMNQ
ncbi:MAG: chemotaxis protein CheW [Acidobacteria bacterium]|nr:chemotaxis protein CheW [Acidobacteriota bacterium]